MGSLSIGLSGLRVAQQGIDLIGTNIANAGTEGYHKQRLQIVPLQLGEQYGVVLGGADVSGVRRFVDRLLEMEMYQQQPQLGQAAQELTDLRLIEAALGDLETGGLATALNTFLAALGELSSQPRSVPLQEQAAWAADSLGGEFRRLAQFLADLDKQIRMEAMHATQQINNLTTEIASINQEIQALGLRGANVNLLADRRDQAITELAELADIQIERESPADETLNVLAWGIPVVTGSWSTNLEATITDENRLAISVEGARQCHTDFRGGKVGGLLALKNELIADIRDRLDLLAAEIINAVNRHHVQGLGPAGAFTSLTGGIVGDEIISDWETWGSYVSDGDFYIRVTDQQAQTVTRYAVHVDPANDDIQDIADKIVALGAPLTASVTNGALHIEVTDADRYTFDFLPTPMAIYGGTWSAANTAEVGVSGIYTGQQNEDFTVTVINGGTVGVTAGLALQVRDGGGNLVRTFLVGDGYAPTEVLDLENGIQLTLSAGTLVDGDSFTVQALASSDTSGLLAAAGINTLFSGRCARTLGVCQRILDDPSNLASAVGADLADNTNVRRMAALSEQPLDGLGGVTATDHYRLTVTAIGQHIMLRQTRYDSLNNVMQQLISQRDGFSGVDINAEAAQLLIFEQMFQAMAVYIQTQNRAMQFIINTM